MAQKCNKKLHEKKYPPEPPHFSEGCGAPESDKHLQARDRRYSCLPSQFSFLDLANTK